MSKYNKAISLLLLVTSVSCGGPKEQLPPDLFEEGWDEASATQRLDVLRSEIEKGLRQLEQAEGDGAERDRERVTAMLSALRAELGATEDGRAEYALLEERFEALTGD